MVPGMTCQREVKEWKQSAFQSNNNTLLKVGFLHDNSDSCFTHSLTWAVGVPITISESEMIELQSIVHEDLHSLNINS